MPKVLKIDKDSQEGLRDLLKSLLEGHKVSGVLALRRLNDKTNAMAYSLITDPLMLEDAQPLFPVMPNNAGQVLSNLTSKGGSSQPIAAAIRPCELRAFVELVKFQKGELDNILIISSTCGGVYPYDLFTDGDLGDTSEYWKAVKGGDIPADIRPCCRSCENFIPFQADMTVSLIGNDVLDKQCTILCNTQRSLEFIEGMAGELNEGELGDLSEHRSKRTQEKERLFQELGLSGSGIEGLIDIFGRCIGCKGCRAVCPICFCQLCTFDSQDLEYRPSVWESELKARGGLRIPPNTLNYHLGRLDHIALSCVACGACEDVCPVDIPISQIYKMVGTSVQEMFDYLSGRDVKEEIPLKTFETEELQDIEN